MFLGTTGCWDDMGKHIGFGESEFQQKLYHDMFVFEIHFKVFWHLMFVLGNSCCYGDMVKSGVLVILLSLSYIVDLEY
jgi:hypothetical protein